MHTDHEMVTVSCDNYLSSGNVRTKKMSRETGPMRLLLRR